MHCIESGLRAACLTAGLAALTLISACGSRPVASDTAPTKAASSSGAAPRLSAPKRSRNFEELKLQVAQRMVAAHPTGTYTSEPPEVLLAIPVLEVELNGNGTVRRIKVLRKPGQAPETTQMAIDAVRRAAPFGDVSHLPKPWTFAEAFLFRDDRKFKPRSLQR